jgi:hypothetical protein
MCGDVCSYQIPSLGREGEVPAAEEARSVAESPPDTPAQPPSWFAESADTISTR